MGTRSGPNVADLPSREHEPIRPDWVCVTDGEDWPCKARRQGLMLVADTPSRALAMVPYFEQACADMPAERAGELWQRFYGWIRDDQSATAEPVRRSGSPWT